MSQPSPAPTQVVPQPGAPSAPACLPLPSSERLLEEHGGLLVALARTFLGLGVPLEDLLSEARIGLLEAARRWDRHRGVPFARYAVWWIRREVLRAVRFQGCLLAIPDRDWRRMHGGHDALPEHERLRMPRWVSLSQPRDPDDGDSEPLQIADERAIDPGDETLRREAEERLRRALDHLPERERRIIHWKYGFRSGESRSLAEAARRLGVSRERARQIEARARRRLRDCLESDSRARRVV